jgi:hypothetical protein
MRWDAEQFSQLNDLTAVGDGLRSENPAAGIPHIAWQQGTPVILSEERSCREPRTFVRFIRLWSGIAAFAALLCVRSGRWSGTATLVWIREAVWRATARTASRPAEEPTSLLMGRSPPTSNPHARIQRVIPHTVHSHER